MRHMVQLLPNTYRISQFDCPNCWEKSLISGVWKYFQLGMLAASKQEDETRRWMEIWVVGRE